MEVAKITEAKAQEITGEPASPVRVFNPVQDADGNWVVSLTEALSLEPEDYEIIEFKPVV